MKFYITTNTVILGLGLGLGLGFGLDCRPFGMADANLQYKHAKGKQSNIKGVIAFAAASLRLKSAACSKSPNKTN